MVCLIAFLAGGRARTFYAQSSEPNRIEAEIVTIRPFGFEPSRINRQDGRFLLFVQNRSGNTDLILRLDRLSGQRLREVRLPKTKLNFEDFIELPAGTHVLTEANHSQWKCEIVVRNR
jgi:hypothetical protein